MFVICFIDIILRLTCNKQCNWFIIANVPRVFPLDDPKNLFGAIPENKMDYSVSWEFKNMRKII